MQKGSYYVTLEMAVAVSLSLSWEEFSSTPSVDSKSNYIRERYKPGGRDPICINVISFPKKQETPVS